MALELIIQEIKVLGNLKVKNIKITEEDEEEVLEERRYRVKIGTEQFISKECGTFISPNELHFNQPFSYFYDHVSHLLFIEIFAKHQYLDNSDMDQLLFAQVDLADLHSLHGDYVQTSLTDVEGESVGKLILTVQTFKKGLRCFEKVSSKQFFQAVKDEYEKMQASEAAKNIKNLIVNNTLADTLMTISSITLICEKQDNQIFMREGFLMVRYGLQIKAFTSLLKITSKDNANWTDYMQFLKNQGVKFQFFFFHYDQLGHIICKAKGEIKYVIFDQTINMHSITLFDKRSAKYGVLMVKFNEKEVDKVNINNKMDKKLIPIEPMIPELLEEFNRYKFESKFNNKILSQKQWQVEQKQQAEQQQKQRPINPEQKKKNEEHSKFITFLQKEMIKIERQLQKRQHNQKKDDRKSMFLPTLDKKMNESRVVSRGDKLEERYHRKMNSSGSVQEFQSVKLPKI